MEQDGLVWTDVDLIAERLEELFPDVDPYTLRFTKLREMVESIPEFSPDPEKHVNEQILEAIQAEWVTLRS